MAYFSRFTERAQRALINAQKEAAAMGKNYVGTEHLLLGVLADPGVSKSIIGDITADKARIEILNLLGQGDSAQGADTLSYTPRSKKIMELAAREARDLRQNYISPEHLLLALMREREGVAAHVLVKMGLDLNKAREDLLKALGAGDELQGEDAKGKETPNLDQYSRDLTKAAAAGELDPIIGREKEIERIVQILSRRTKNNPVLIGEPGVGKSAIAEGLAQLIAADALPDMLRGRRVVSLDLAGMLAGTKFRGEFEERLKNTMAEIRECGNVILFIDELHTIVGAGAAEGAIDAANIMKPVLARGELQCIGATTLSEYRKHIEKDAALARRFQPVMVGEPTPEEAVEILFGLKEKYEAHHKVRITDEAVRSAVMLSDRYISDRFLPDKAIDLVDEACSRVRIKAFTAPPDMKDKQKRIEELTRETEEAVANEDFEKAAHLRDEKKLLQNEMQEKRAEWEKLRDSNMESVGEDDVAAVVSGWTGIPVSRMTEDEAERLMKLESILHERVIGQEEAVTALAKAVRRARAGLKDPERPIGSFIFLGPTGVGKTELCKALGEALFGDKDSLIRIDMSEYMEKYSVSRLFGAPPGYVGYEEGGQLTEKVRRKPYSVILFDEVEKASPDVFNTLLQILEDGRMTDGQGRTVDFKNTVLVMTSNAGADLIRQQKHLGFGSGADEPSSDYDTMKETVLNEVKRVFRPEFINRVDEIMVFHALEKHEIEQIARLMLEKLALRLEERGISLRFNDASVEYLASEGYDPKFGARPLRRAIQHMVEDALSEEILSGKVRLGETVLMQVTENGDGLIFVPERKALEEAVAP